MSIIPKTAWWGSWSTKNYTNGINSLKCDIRSNFWTKALFYTFIVQVSAKNYVAFAWSGKRFGHRALNLITIILDLGQVLPGGRDPWNQALQCMTGPEPNFTTSNCATQFWPCKPLVYALIRICPGIGNKK